IVHVLRVGARSGGLGAGAVVALGVSHAMREGVPNLVFQAEPETLAQMRLERVVLLIAFRCRTGYLRNLPEQRRVARQVRPRHSLAVDDQLLQVWLRYHQVRAVLADVPQ